MNASQHVLLSSIALCLCPVLHTINAEDKNYGTAKIKVTHQIAKDLANNNDLCATMASAGIDFPVLLQRALDGNDKAIRLLIWAGEHVKLDGAASELYSYTMVRAAKKIGDDKMALAVKGLKMESFPNTRMFLKFEFRFDDNEVAAITTINKLFPKFWSEITKQVEQKVKE